MRLRLWIHAVALLLEAVGVFSIFFASAMLGFALLLAGMLLAAVVQRHRQSLQSFPLFRRPGRRPMGKLWKGPSGVAQRRLLFRRDLWNGYYREARLNELIESLLDAGVKITFVRWKPRPQEEDCITAVIELSPSFWEGHAHTAVEALSAALTGMLKNPRPK